MNLHYNTSEDHPPSHSHSIDYQYQNTCTKTITFNQDSHYCLICEESDISVDFNLAMPDIKAVITILCLGTSNTHLSCKTRCIHSCDNTESQTHMITFCKDHSKVQAHGDIHISQQTKKTSGHLLQENILLGEHLRLKVVPMLHIHSKDVQASHGAKTHKIDHKKLHYMQSKGLDPSAAQELIIKGYLNLVFDPFSPHNEDQINEIKDIILQKIL